MNAQSKLHPFYDDLMTHLGRHWVLLLICGILSLTVGTVGLAMTGLMTVASLIYFGVCLVAVGIAEIIHGFMSKRWKILGRVLLGLLFVAGGVSAIFNPVSASVTLTLFLGIMLLTVGALRIADALRFRYGQWGWRLFHGIVTAALGFMVTAQWPTSALWFIGLAVSIELLFNGWQSIIVALASRKYVHEHHPHDRGQQVPAHAAI
jgi:uncharacterized membrane protein HdeD (DUF308 family)